jgi:hypothetical protein
VDYQIILLHRGVVDYQIMAGVSSFAKEVGFVRTIDMQKGFLRPGSLSEAASAVNDGSGKD